MHFAQYSYSRCTEVWKIIPGNQNHITFGRFAGLLSVFTSSASESSSSPSSPLLVVSETFPTGGAAALEESAGNFVGCFAFSSTKIFNVDVAFDSSLDRLGKAAPSAGSFSCFRRGSVAESGLSRTCSFNLWIILMNKPVKININNQKWIRFRSKRFWEQTGFAWKLSRGL